MRNSRMGRRHAISKSASSFSVRVWWIVRSLENLKRFSGSAGRKRSERCSSIAGKSQDEGEDRCEKGRSVVWFV